MNNVIRVLLADDHSLVRSGFRRMLEDEPDFEVVGEAADGFDAVRLAVELKPQVIVMDFTMPGLDGATATRQIRTTNPAIAVLMLSMHSGENYVRNAIDAGAAGYLLKDAVDVDLPDAIRKIARGEKYLSPALQRAALDDDDTLSKITPRERQVLTLIAQGKSNKEIGFILNLSANTVAVHRANLMEALGIHKAAELVLYAVRKGLVTPP
jgi:DNA-binding NarL/FixJ family response regulator